MMKVMLRGGAVWLLIIFAETIHGTARVLLAEPIFGEARARQVAVLSGMAIIFVITYALIRKIGASGTAQLLALGAVWVVLTICFEVLLGRLAFGFEWERIVAEYDVRTGSLMPVGLVFMFFAPYLADHLRGRSG